MSLNWIHFFILGYYLVSKANAIRCYTCGGSEENSISCSNFEFEDPRFSKECDTGSRSCRLSRKVNENIILSRSCESIQLNDCKTANSIEYCYCTKDLCNKIILSDDDDEEEEQDFLDVEGSGSRKIDMATSTETKHSNQEDITISNGKSNINPDESVEKNIISSSCSVYQSMWYLMSIIMFYLYI